MKEHLPECRSHITGAVYPNRDDVPWDEIGDTKHCWLCDILRACEKRVLGASRKAIEEASSQWPSNWDRALGAAAALAAIDSLDQQL